MDLISSYSNYFTSHRNLLESARKDKKTQKNNHDTSSDHSSGWWAHSASDTGDCRNDHSGSSDSGGDSGVAAEIDICSEKGSPPLRS